MKCTKCGEEWQIPPGRSMNFCPNCGTSTPTPASTVPSTGNVIKALITTHSLKDGLFLEPSILLSLAADKLQDGRRELLEHIEFAILKKVPQDLYALKAADEHERLLKMNVILDSLKRSFNESTSYEMVNLFAEALGFSLLKVQGNGGKRNPQIGELYYFADRDWRILDIQNGKALILSEKIIEQRVYNEQLTDTTWAECTLQSYLNGAFYNSLGQEKFRISKTRIVTPKNPWYGTNGGKDIDNWIFLLSIEEVAHYLCGIQNVQEYLDKSEAKNEIRWWINDEYNEKRKANGDTDTASWWWLRSPGRDGDCAALVHSRGRLGIGSLYGVSVSGGVRPALWLNL